VRAGHRDATGGGSSVSISSHNSRHSLQIRASPADAMAATWRGFFPQKLHCSAPPSSRTWIVAMGVLTVRPGSATTVRAPPMHWPQMYTCGPAINFLTCFWLFPQNEHNRRLPESGTRPLYSGGRARPAGSARERGEA